MSKNDALMKRIYPYLAEKPDYRDIVLVYLGVLAAEVDKAKKITAEPGKVPTVAIRADSQALRDAADLIMELIDHAKDLQERLDRIEHANSPLTIQ